jgi:diguanylate cyclase (GGDEF)-like protein
VRSCFGLVFVSVTILLLGGTAALARQSLDRARRDGRSNARYLARVTGDIITKNVALGSKQVESVAANPSVPGLLDAPSRCDLQFNLELFPGSRLDLVGPAGRVMCSSAGDATGEPVRDAGPWLTRMGTATKTFQSEPYTDERLDGTAVAIVAPVLDPSHRPLGGIALIVATDQIADLLEDTYGGDQHYQFAVVDKSSAWALSAPGARSGNLPMSGGKGAGVFPHGYITARAPIEGSDWMVVAAVSEDGALAPARSALKGQLALTAAVLLLLLAAVMVIYRLIARPLRRLTTAVAETGPRSERALETVTGPREVLILAEQLRGAALDRAVYEEQLVHQSFHDPLTELPNRALMTQRLDHSLRQAGRSGAQVSVLIVDLDRFKLINDGLGHGAGDDVLIEVAARLSQAGGPGDTIGRFGADEFVIVHERLPDDEAPERLCDRILDALKVPIEVADTILRLNASIGLAHHTAEQHAGELLRDADAALHVAKRRGAARYEVFGPDAHVEVTERLAMESELSAALERRELHLVYQPKVDLRTGDTVGLEALARWTHPKFGAVPPTAFIPVAEDTGLILELGRFVLEEACSQAADWSRQGSDVIVAVNVSARQLADTGLPDLVATVLADTGVPPERICIELTESILMGDTVQTVATLEALHRLGLLLSIDDFGTGYSSLAYLHRFPVDELKIDRVFVQELTVRPESRTLVAAMIAMGRALGLSIVAEGVETVAQAAALRELGCDIAQGYLYSRPERAETFNGILSRTTQRQD